MKDFIRFNIENVKGRDRPSSLIDRDLRRDSPTKPKFRQQPSRPYNHETLPQKVKRLEMELSLRNQTHQADKALMDEIHEIKHDIRMIKSLLFSQKSTVSKLRNHSDAFEDEDEQETISTHNKRMRSQGSEAEEFRQGHSNSQGSSPPKRVYKLEDIINQKQQRSSVGAPIKSVLSAIKDYKIEGPQFGTIFFGYAKRNSQPVAIKLFEGKMNNVLEVYDRLWKNIAKAPWPCINRIFDYKSEENDFLVMSRNKGSIVGLPYKTVLADIVKMLEFVHECGYLYRNIEPEHFMLNEEGQLVLIDLKRARRYIDIKGHPIEVCDSIYTGSPFASNSQVRCLPESRKDDLESVGYLALLMLEMEIPWAGMNKEQVVNIRSSLTLQELFKGQPRWVEYMAYVMRLPRHERPDYKYLVEVISQ